VRTVVSTESLLLSGEGQDEGDFTAIFPLTPTLSRRERESNVHYLLVGSVTGYEAALILHLV